MDKDRLLEICLFKSLVHFVEKEKGLEYYGVDWSEEIKNGHVDQEYADRVQARDALIKHCYDWIKVDRLEEEPDAGLVAHKGGEHGARRVH